MDTPGIVVLFDGDCNLCSRANQLIRRYDRNRRIRTMARSSVEGRAFLDSRNCPEQNDTILVWTGNRFLMRSDAALEIAWQLGGMWRLLYAGRIIPRSWRDGIYNMVARNRYAWFGRATHCPIHP
jgi:predicted DCC family thiol-disulfide oxidoreductase YuxK